MVDQQFARLTWEKRFNTVRDVAYVGSVSQGSEVFAVCVLGSVTILPEDIPHYVAQLREMADVLEQHHRDHPPSASDPQPPKPGRRRKVRRCDQHTTRNATSYNLYTTCDTPLNAQGECAHASQHVDL